MDGRQDQVILVDQRRRRLRAGRIWRVERQFGQEPFARRIAGGDLLELQQIVPPDHGIFVHPLQVRLVPDANALQVARPIGLPVT